MSKIEKKSKKVKHYFTLNENINDKFEKFIIDNVINKPKFIEKLIINYLKEHNIE